MAQALTAADKGNGKGTGQPQLRTGRVSRRTFAKALAKEGGLGRVGEAELTRWVSCGVRKRSGRGRGRGRGYAILQEYTQMRCAMRSLADPRIAEFRTSPRPQGVVFARLAGMVSALVPVLVLSVSGGVRPP